MDKKSVYIVCGILTFVITTTLVLLSDTSSRKKVSFTNRNFIINNENAEVKNEDVTINMNKSQLSNKSVDFNSTKINNQNVEFNNNGSLDNQNTNISNYNSSFENQQTEFDPKLAKYQEQQREMQQIQEDLNNPKPKDDYEKYVYQNINWNKWKSNFVNKIIDDSMYIKSLDNYNLGSMFYYSFIVTSTGEIRNVKVQSIHLTTEDKIRVANLIKNYAHTPITKFPPNSRRATAKVEAVVMLGSTESKSKPSDFNDIEHIKMNLSN